MEIRALQLAVIAILDNALDYEWSVQGFGMLRLYIRDIGRLHIWDSALRYPGVSMIHNHSWDLHSTVVAGKIRNTRYTDVPSEGYQTIPGVLYSGKRLITGYNTSDVQQLMPVRLYEDVVETIRAGQDYAQAASEIHRTDAHDGTISIMARQEDEQGQADVYWPAGTEWGTAKPRPATDFEVSATVRKAITVLLA